MMNNQLKGENLQKQLKRNRTQNSLNKQVFIYITLETMHLVFERKKNKKQTGIRNLILVRNRNEIDQQRTERTKILATIRLSMKLRLIVYSNKS